ELLQRLRRKPQGLGHHGDAMAGLTCYDGPNALRHAVEEGIAALEPEKESRNERQRLAAWNRACAVLVCFRKFEHVTCVTPAMRHVGCSSCRTHAKRAQTARDPSSSRRSALGREAPCVPHV